MERSFSKSDTPTSLINLFESSCAKRVKTVLSKVFFWDAWRLYVRSFYNHSTPIPQFRHSYMVTVYFWKYEIRVRRKEIVTNICKLFNSAQGL